MKRRGIVLLQILQIPGRVWAASIAGVQQASLAAALKKMLLLCKLYYITSPMASG